MVLVWLKNLHLSKYEVDCPADCASDEFIDGIVFGTSTYESESSICRAAIHDGRIDNHNGGLAYAQKVDNTKSFKGVFWIGIERGLNLYLQVILKIIIKCLISFG